MNVKFSSTKDDRLANGVFAPDWQIFIIPRLEVHMDKDLVEKVEKTARKVCAEANRDIWSDDELATLIAERLGVEEKAVADALRMIPHERIVGKDGDVIALAKGRFLQVYVDDSGALAVRLTDCPIGEWHDGILISIEGR
ncbi:MAG: hypothetical protein QXP36_00930, partial [Conexivisphaerales archaeon]